MKVYVVELTYWIVRHVMVTQTYITQTWWWNDTLEITKIMLWINDTQISKMDNVNDRYLFSQITLSITALYGRLYEWMKEIKQLSQSIAILSMLLTPRFWMIAYSLSFDGKRSAIDHLKYKKCLAVQSYNLRQFQMSLLDHRVCQRNRNGWPQQRRNIPWRQAV